ncbi:MAG: hypothetical protein K0R47_1792 [Brevibacillus sp.]|nr:hypothetical protein [Brevibacillus sp.]
MEKTKHGLKRPPLITLPETATLDAVSFFTCSRTGMVLVGVPMKLERFPLFPPLYYSLTKWKKGSGCISRVFLKIRESFDKKRQLVDKPGK